LGILLSFEEGSSEVVSYVRASVYLYQRIEIF
jgi:hypothetical protein